MNERWGDVAIGGSLRLGLRVGKLRSARGVACGGGCGSGAGDASRLVGQSIDQMMPHYFRRRLIRLEDWLSWGGLDAPRLFNTGTYVLPYVVAGASILASSVLFFTQP